jgi:site-specific DNA-cytosine methylase
VKLMPATRTYRVGHLCCGIGGGEKGFKDATPRVGGVTARFECAGGIDVDAGAIRNFNRVAPGRGVVMDLFDEEQYRVFHDGPPPPGWREQAPEDIRRAFGEGPLDVLFASMPCKGFSGLLSQKVSTTPKYEALNRLTLRGIWLALEAYKDDPISIILFENVPRIENRGRPLLQRIEALLAHYGYVFAETKHDCGEIGNLAQSRRRFLLVARHAKKVPPFLYEPVKHRLRGVGEVIGLLPLPGDPSAGVMHRVPRLQWKTWVRLAFVPPGKDWRALNELTVENGVLRDFGIVPEGGMRDNQLGVVGWNDTAPTITSQRAPGQGRFAVADPRVESDKFVGSGRLGVRDWAEPTGAVAGASRPENGAYNVADPREAGYRHHGTLGVTDWEEPAGVVAGASRPSNGPHSVADPRPQQANQSFHQYGVREWDDPAATVTGQAGPGGGPNSVADPRLHGTPRFNNVFRIVPFTDPSPAIAGPGGAGGGVAVADPRADSGFGGKGKYRITAYDEPAGTVIGGSTTGQGAFAVADPRGGDDPSKLHGKHRVEEWAGEPSRAVIAGRDNGATAVADPRPGYGPGAHLNILSVAPFDAPAKAVTGASHVAGGALSVADPRPVGLNAAGREGYATQGHYGVVGWDDSSGAVPGYAKFDRGNWSVADPREQDGEAAFTLPAPNEKIVARIIARDGTWHRPFTTLELAALQSLFDPGEIFDLEGGSDQLKREWIGNAVPSAAARGMAETIGETLLRAEMGEAFTLSSREIWTKPLALALAVDPRQLVYGEWVGGAA